MSDRVAIPGTERVIWPGSRHAEALASGADVRLTAWLRPRSGGELDTVAAQRISGTPPLLRTYTDRKTLAKTTGADPDDVDVLRKYCKRFGLDVADVSWRAATISGPIEQLVKAFGATVAIFEDGGGTRFRHRSEALHVPSEVAAVVRGIFGMHQWPRSQKLGSLQRHATPLLARDVAGRYAFPDADGRGQTIGIVQLGGIFKPDDFDACMKAQGVSPAQPIVKRVDDTALAHDVATFKDLEAALDVQIAGALAPGARIVVYEAANDERGFLDAIHTAIFDEEYAPGVLSISYGWPEPLWTPIALAILEDLFTVAALVGVSVFCSSGDDGAELDYDGTPHVVAPASSPFGIACGATVIATPGDGGEQAWEKTGGGFSDRFDVPEWQSVARASAAHNRVPAGRGVPDVAGQQGPGYYVVMDGVELAMGGTSAVAPMWAALAARLNQRLGVPIGFFLPILYRKPDGLFTEITTGNNDRFAAGPGWDPCTGLGVPIGAALETALRG
jgi:kumamolisin